MFFCYVFLVVSLMTSLRHLHVSGCDENCADKPVFTPSRLVVKYGDPTSATCVVCKDECRNHLFDLEKSVGVRTKNGTTIEWTVDRMTEWDTSATCFYNTDAGDQCCSNLPVTVYQPPENVSISFVNHTGPMFDCGQYTLRCSVQNVAPLQSLVVTFYRGQTTLAQLQSSSEQKKPVSESFTLSINTSKEDDGAQYWCEAKLQLGAEGPQPPPVVTSEKLTATVHYGPQLNGPANPDPIKLTKGSTLRLNCSAVGNPSPSYTWTHPSGISPCCNGSVLTIKSVGFQHGGHYICNVSTNTGTVTVNFNVNVEANPIPYIVAGVIVAAVLVVLGVLIGYVYYYKHNRMGRYNLKDVLRFHVQHIALPTEE